MPGLPYATKKYIMHGHIGAAQTWSCSVTADHSAPMTEDELQALANEALAPCTTLWNTLKLINDTDCRFEGVSVYQYSAGQSASTGVGQSDAVSIAGTGSPSLPTQTALVLSTQDGLPGRHHRGRCFFPMTTGPLETHQMAPAGVDGIVAAAVVWVTALSELPASNTAIGLIVPTSVGSPRRISTVAVDSRPDVIRARADKAVARYRKATAIPPRA